MHMDQAILDLVNREEVSDQATLRDRLVSMGHSMTQPTLSRRLKKLGIQKEQGVYRRPEPGMASAPYYALNLAPPNLIVLHTRPGHAQLVAVLLDATDIEGTVGTLAGDDTVFVAVKASNLDAVAERVRFILDQRA